jgi:hypothetical protein
MRERFLRVYSNLPLNLRDEIVAVLPGKGPLTWNVAYSEVSNNTPLGEEILATLDELKII